MPASWHFCLSPRIANLVNQEVAHELLASLGLRVIVAGDGAQAIAAFQRETPDVVFMDCQMPSVDGYAATRSIREIERREGLPRAPIIALTANALQEDRDRCLESGMDDFLGKPFETNGLVEVLARWLSPRAAGKGLV